MAILLTFVLTAAVLIVLLWAGTMFLQGYIYTEPTPGIAWQAPAAGGALAAFLTLWFVLVANSPGDGPLDIPYDTLFRFSPKVDKYKDPVKELYAETKSGTIKFTLKKQHDRPPVYRQGNGEGWRSGVTAIVIKDKDGETRYEPRVAKSGAYQEYVGEGGWVLTVYGDGPRGIPTAFRWGRFLLSLFLNFMHLALWFVCLWLLLRFQWSHALGLAVVLWLLMTVAVLPMMLEQAGAMAQKSAAGVKQT